MGNIIVDQSANINLTMEEITTNTAAHADSLTPKFKQLLENDSAIVKSLLNYILTSEKGSANGVATLGADGKLLQSQRPPDIVIPAASISQSGIVQLSSSLTDSSENKAATPKAIYDLKKHADDQLALKAPMNSPTLTGVPTVPTAAAGTNNTQVASTAFVQEAIAPKAPLASPVLTGIPIAPTPITATDSTQIATTAFVKTNLKSKADIASPALTGTPTAPTASTGSKSTQIATTAFVQSALDNYNRAGCKAAMSSAQSGGNIYFQCGSLSQNVGSYFEVESIDIWGYALKAKKDMYFIAHVNFVYSASSAGRKRCGILKIYTSTAYLDLGESYNYSIGGTASTACTVYGQIAAGQHIVAYTQGSSSDTVGTEGTFLFVNEL